MDAKELKPCPFCGGEPKMYYPFHLMGKPGHAATYHGGVRCSQCGCESKANTPVDDSISSWNARAALPSDAAQAPLWQPIETAPKDGTVIDLWIAGEFAGRHASCFWGKPEHCCGEMGGLCDSDWHDLEDGWVDDMNMPLDGHEPPTHWAPLPASPEAAPVAPAAAAPSEWFAEFERLLGSLDTAHTTGSMNRHVMRDLLVEHARNRISAAAQPDERSEWDETRHSLAVAISAFVTRPAGNRGLDAAAQLLDAITEPGSPLAWLRANAPQGGNHA